MQALDAMAHVLIGGHQRQTGAHAIDQPLHGGRGLLGKALHQFRAIGLARDAHEIFDETRRAILDAGHTLVARAGAGDRARGQRRSCHPGRSRFSTIATDAPASCPAIAAASPQAPAPMTRMSMSGGITRKVPSLLVGAGPPLNLVAPPLPPRRRPSALAMSPDPEAFGHGRVKLPGQRRDLASQLGFAERIVRSATSAVDTRRPAAAVGERHLDAGGPVFGPRLEVVVRHQAECGCAAP